MSWLHTIISALNESEMAEVRKLRIIGKEKEVWDCIYSYAKKEAPSQSKICEHVQINDSHYYKINSVLLDKLFTQLVPQGGFLLLNWLRNKELYVLLKNEFKAQQKQQHSSDYYLNSFRLLIDLPFKFFDEKLIRYASVAYLKSLTDCSESDRMYVKYHLLFADCNRFAAGKNPEKQFSYSEYEWQRMETELQVQKHYLALYYLYRTLCNYYNYYKRDASLSLAYIEKAIQLKDKIADFFPINIHQFLRLLYADSQLKFNNVEHSFLMYNEVFKEGVDVAMYGFYYHCEQFAVAAILHKKFDKAESILHTYFDACLERKNDIYATRGTLAFAKLYLSKGEFKLAQQFINLGMEINEKSIYLPFEIQLRALENIYFFLKGDYLFAKQLANRNAKYISNQKAKELTKNYRSFFKLILAFIQCIEQKKTFPLNLKDEYASAELNFKSVFCNLIPMMFSKMQQEIE